VQDGIRLLELSKRPIFCTNIKIQAKAEVAQFRVFELNMEGSNSHLDVSPTIWSTSNYEHNLAKRKGRPSRFQRPSSYLAPHTGQSSQLAFDASERDAQFPCSSWHQSQCKPHDCGLHL